MTPVERNRVRVNIDVDEGTTSKIQQIRFVGNKVYSEGDLRDEMQLGTPNWFSWYTKRDQYSREKLEADLEAIRALYNNNGYLDFKIDSTQVSISPDKSGIYVTINVDEGKRYKIKGIRLTGDMLGLEPEFEELVDIKPAAFTTLRPLMLWAKSSLISFRRLVTPLQEPFRLRLSIRRMTTKSRLFIRLTRADASTFATC